MIKHSWENYYGRYHTMEESFYEAPGTAASFVPPKPFLGATVFGGTSI